MMRAAVRLASAVTMTKPQRQPAHWPTMLASGTPAMVAAVRPSIMRPTAWVRRARGTRDAATREPTPKKAPWGRPLRKRKPSIQAKLGASAEAKIGQGEEGHQPDQERALGQLGAEYGDGGGADDDAEGIGADEVAGGGLVDAEAGGELRQQAHRGELGGSDGEAAGGQREDGEPGLAGRRVRGATGRRAPG